MNTIEKGEILAPDGGTYIKKTIIDELKHRRERKLQASKKLIELIELIEKIYNGEKISVDEIYYALRNIQENL